MLPVFIEDCESLVAMAHLKRCKLFGLSEEDARASFEAYVAEAKPPEEPARFPGGVKTEKPPAAAQAAILFPGRKFALSNIRGRAFCRPKHTAGG